jgi:multidrug efflux pump subunit AcrB
MDFLGVANAKSRQGRLRLIPLVTSLAFGLMATTVLVLFLVPAMYSILDDFGLAKID